MSGPELNIEQKVEDQNVNAQEVADLVKTINEDPESKKTEKEIAKNIYPLYSSINKSVLSNGEVKSDLSSEDLGNYLTVLNYMSDLIIMDEAQQSLYNQIDDLQDKLDKQRQAIDPAYAAERNAPIEITEEQRQKYEQERQLQDRQRFESNMARIGYDFVIDSNDLSLIQDAIDKGYTENIKSRAWTEVKPNGKKVRNEDNTGRIQPTIQVNHYWNELIENGLNTPNLSETDIAAYKNVVDQLTGGKYEGNESVYNAINRKEFDIIYASVNGTPDVANAVYAKYLSTSNAQDLLNLSYTDKATNIINQIDPARLETFNKTSLQQNLIDTGVFTQDILNSSINIGGTNYSVYENYADDFNKKMENLASYSDTEKSNLAFMLVALKPLTSTEKAIKIKNSNKTFGQVQGALLKGYQIVDGFNTITPSTDTKDGTISKDLFAAYSEQIQELRHDDMLTVYKSFYAPGNEIPPMSPVNVSAVGDLSSTMGFKIPNYGREYFGYDLEKQSTQVNQVFFGLKKDVPMEIYMGANGLNQKADGSGGMTFSMEFKKSPNSPENFTITGIYKDNGQGPELTILDNPGDIQVTKNGQEAASIVIPPQYNGYNMTLTQIAGEYAGNSGFFDETNLNISIKNGRYGHVAPGEEWSADQTVQYLGGSADMPKDQQNQMRQSIDDIAYYAYRSVAEEIPMTVSSGVNDWKITGSLDGYKDFSVAHLTNPKLQEAWTTYESFIDNADDASLQFPEDWDDAQDNAQKVLAKRRFINALTLIQESPDMLKLLDSGKVKIVPNYLFNQKAASVSVDVTQFVAKK